jgi:hypothetical protein
LPIGPILGQQVDGVPAVIRVHLHVSDNGNLPPRPVDEYSLALAAHLYEVRLEEPAVLGIDDADHPSLPLHTRAEHEGSSRVGEYP